VHDNEELALRRTVEVLVEAFPVLGERHVSERVAEVLARFEGARVRVYVPVLVAREARAVLAADTATVTVDGQGARTTATVPRQREPEALDG